MKSIPISLAVGVLLTICGPALAAEFPVRWTKTIGLRSLTEIPATMDRRVDMSKAGGELVLAEPYPKDGKKQVDTCRQYLDLIKQGYSAYSTYDITMESWFKDSCGPLALLEMAKSSNQSFLTKFDISKNPLIDLPPSAYPALSGDESKEALAAERSGKRLGTFKPKAKIQKSKKHSITIKYEDATATYDQVAWGDFDHDGIEDVLIFRSERVSGGSYRSYEHYLISKKAVDAPIQMRPIDYALAPVRAE